MRFQAGIQIVLLITAGVIAFSVIKPKFESINKDQDEVVSYKDAVANIGQYNQRLQTLISQANSLSSYDRSVLFRYLPEDIDATMVADDISNIVTKNQLLLLDIVPDIKSPVTEVTPDMANGGGVVDPNTGVVAVDGNGLTIEQDYFFQQFKVEVVGTYAQMKQMLQDFERNAYPLRLVEFKFDIEKEQGNLIQFSLVLETYSLASN